MAPGLLFLIAGESLFEEEEKELGKNAFRCEETENKDKGPGQPITIDTVPFHTSITWAVKRMSDRLVEP